MKRPAISALIAAAGLLVITACAGTSPQAPSNADDPKTKAEQAAIKYQTGNGQDKCNLDASKTGEKLRQCLDDAAKSTATATYSEAPHVVATETWRDGYAVSLQYQPANGTQLVVIYGMQVVDGQWKMVQFNQLAEKDKNAPNRVCLTLGDC